MRDILWEFFKAVVGGSVMGILMALPFIGVIGSLYFIKKRYKAERVDPFTELPLRPAGESLRLKIDDLADAQVDKLLIAFLAPLTGYLLISSASPSINPYIALIVFVAVIVVCLIVVLRLAKGLRNLWNHKLAFTGERVVGEELNQLIANGYHVFHDLPYENFNIDHVIVGPSGVYAVETKTRRKPKANGQKAWKITYDGQSIYWPTGRDDKSIAQASAAASSLSKLLSGKTGESVWVQPIVTIPGWWVDDSTQHPVWVLNPKRIQGYVTRTKEKPLAQKLINQITYQLTEHCRLKQN